MRPKIKLLFFIIVLISCSHVFAESPDKNSIGSTLLLLGTQVSSETPYKDIKSLSRKIEDTDSPERIFLLAYTSYMLGKYSEAERLFSKCMEADLPVKDYILFFRADSALKRGMPLKSEKIFKELISNYQDSILYKKAKLGLAYSLVMLKKNIEARELLLSALSKDESNNDQFDIHILIAKSYLNEKKEDKVFIELKRLASLIKDKDDLLKILSIADSFSSKQKMIFYQWIGSSDAKYLIGKSLVSNSQWRSAIPFLEQAAINPSSKDNKADILWLIIDSYYRLHDYAKAIELIEARLEKDNIGDTKNLFLIRLARSYARTDHYDKSIEIWQQIIKENRKSIQIVLNAKFSIAYLLIDDGRYNEAVKVLEQILRIRTSGSVKLQANWFLAWSYYKLGKYDAAHKRFARLLREGRSIRKIKDRLYYWQARTLEKLGKSKEAKKLYKTVINKYSSGYYAYLAKRRLNNDIRNPQNFAMVKSEHINRDNWIPQYVSSELLLGSTHLAKAIFFDKLKIHREASNEIRTVYNKELKSNEDILLLLASRNYTHDIAYRLIIKQHSSILKQFPNQGGFDLFAWEQAYPRAYQDIVERLSEPDLDSRLIYAMMKAESLYQPEIVSGSGAIGLMQLMPTTAEKLSKEMQKIEFKTKELYEPAKNIEFGINYLKKLYKMFDGKIPVVIASYNAGEEAAGRWLRHGTFDDIEEYIEEIPYKETNHYVKKVLRFYWIIQQLYSESSH